MYVYLYMCLHIYIYVSICICIFMYLSIPSIHPTIYLFIYLLHTQTYVCTKFSAPNSMVHQKKDEKLNAPKAFTMEFKTPKNTGNTNSMGEKRIQNDRTNH